MIKSERKTFYFPLEKARLPFTIHFDYLCNLALQHDSEHKKLLADYNLNSTKAHFGHQKLFLPISWRIVKITIGVVKFILSLARDRVLLSNSACLLPCFLASAKPISLSLKRKERKRKKRAIKMVYSHLMLYTQTSNAGGAENFVLMDYL